MFSPNIILVRSDRIEEYEHHALRKKNTNAINYHQVAQVKMRKGLRWADIIVESSGGHAIALKGVPKSDGDRVKAILHHAVDVARSGLSQLKARRLHLLLHQPHRRRHLPTSCSSSCSFGMPACLRPKSLRCRKPRPWSCTSRSSLDSTGRGMTNDLRQSGIALPPSSLSEDLRGVDARTIGASRRRSARLGVHADARLRAGTRSGSA